MTPTGINLITDLALSIASEICDYDAKRLHQKLIKDGLDQKTRGFWVWDIQNNLEYYSPGFRTTLGYQSETEFPNVPESWQKAIHPEDLDHSIRNFKQHVESGGVLPYWQRVRYYKKNSNKIVSMICYGKVVSWIGNHHPQLMVGVHL